MTRKQRPILDGFIPRRANSQLGEQHRPGASKNETPSGLHPGRPEGAARPTTLRPSNAAAIRSEIDESLKSIDTDGQLTKGKKNRRRGAPRSRTKRIIKWVIILFLVVALGVGAWVAYKAFHAGGNIFKGSILDLVQEQPLKQDANGRSNVLIVGTSEDDPGHDAAHLTDSIMIVSVDQKNKNAYMISIPRDLSVKYGQACMTGYQGKINVYYDCVKEGEGVEADRAALAKMSAFVGEIVGLDIQYGANVNYTVMRELVSAVGGITVNIEGSGGAPGVMDSNFDWKCGEGDRAVSFAERKRRCPPNGHFIEYPNGPAELDAEHALYLAQARGDRSPTYGLGRSNFDRELNQQKIVKAIREKAMTAGVLTDFSKVTGILDALGNNLRTTFETKEIRTLVSLAKDIKSEDIQSISLIDGDNPVMNGNAEPAAGIFQYGDLQAFIKKKLSSDPVVREEANVVVLNGSGVPGVAQKEADALEAKSYTISGIDTAPAGTYAAVEIYQIGEGKTATKAKLEELFGVKTKTSPLPFTVAEGTHFVIIFGQDRSATSQ